MREKGELREDTRYFITSLTDLQLFLKAVCSHWGIENSLYWCLDVVFREDYCRTRKDHSAENFVVIRCIALNVLKFFPAKMSVVRKKRDVLTIWSSWMIFCFHLFTNFFYAFAMFFGYVSACSTEIYTFWGDRWYDE